MVTAKIGRRGQFTLPRLIRRSIGLHEGDRVLLVPDGNQIIIRPLPQTIFDLRGSIPVSEPQDFSAIRRQVISDRYNKTRSKGDSE